MKKIICTAVLMMMAGVCFADPAVTVYVGRLGTAEPNETATITYVTCSIEKEQCSDPVAITVPILSKQLLPVHEPMTDAVITQVSVEGKTVLGPYPATGGGMCSAKADDGAINESLTLEPNYGNTVTCTEGVG